MVHFVSLWRNLVHRKRVERDLDEELRAGFEWLVDEKVRSGVPPNDARRAARLDQGSLESVKDHVRDARAGAGVHSVLQDIRFALRLLRRAPAFTVVALLTLALGIGANTAMFSIVNGVILRPLGYPKPEQLMYLTTQFPALGFRQFWVSPPEYLEFREINRSFSAVGAYTTGEVNLTASDRPLRVRSASVDEHLLNALGMQAAQGRVFARGETDVSGPPPAPGQPAPLPPPIAMLSHELWHTAFGGRPIVGQTVDVNGRPCEVIGIMPPGADVMDNRTEIWLPLGLNPANRQNRGSHFLYLIGRLKDGVTAPSAQTELHALLQTWGERVGVKDHVFASLPKGDAATGATPGHILQMKPLQDAILGGASRSIWVLQAAVGFVLLIACANLANLLLARAETRHREFAVRTALGASRGRLLRQFMTEGVLLSIAGGALGLWLARVGVQALIRGYPTSLPRTSEVTVDPLVLLFTCGVATATGVCCGLAPILHTRVKGLVAALKDGGAKGATGAARHQIRRGLVIAEVAFAVMLAIGAGLLVRTVTNLTNVDAGFDRSRLVTFSMTLPPVTYPQPSARAQLYQTLLGKLLAVPGVQAATAMSGLPPNRPVNANDTRIANYTAPPEGPFENVDYYQNVMADYFETMGIPIVQGRSFQRTDAASPGMVAVVNETLVHTFWKTQNPIGQRLRPCCSDQIPWFTVIGVAKDVKQGGVDQKTGTEVYWFVEQTGSVPPPLASAPGTMNVVLRTTLSPAALSRTLERVVREADRTVPLVRLRNMDAVFAESIQRPRLLAQLLGAFAGLALLLAAIGTYGVLSYTVAERRREIGIRMALGAARSSVLAQVMTQGFLVTTIGVVAGLAGALGLNRLLASLLFGVQPADATTLAAVIATVTLVAAVACGLPAWRASRLDPNVVFRDE
jgi:putative ABC transport system permease protein